MPSDPWSYESSTAGPCTGWDGGYGDGYGYAPPIPVTGDWGRNSGSSAGAVARGSSRPADPSIAISSPGWSPSHDGGSLLSKQIDDVVRAFGLAIYDQIAVDDQAASSIATLIYAIMGGEFSVEPRIELEPGETVDDPKVRADIETANRAAELCRRSIDRVPDFLDQIEAIEFDRTTKGAGLGDKWFVSAKGPDDERPVTLLGGLLCRSRDSWDFVTDKAGRVTGIAGISTTTGQLAVFDRSNFLLAVNSPRRGDPRGTSDLRAAYDPWNLKVQARPQRAKYVNQFANPTVDIGYDPNDQPTEGYNERGELETMPPQRQAEVAAWGYHGSAYLVHPMTWTVNLIESKADGGAFNANEESLNTAIARSILLTARVTQESANNSQADATSAVNVFLMKVARRQKSLTTAIEQDIFKEITRRNLGDDAAERLYPKGMFKMAGHVQAAIIQAVTGLINTKVVPNNVLAKLFRVMGLPTPSVEDLEKMQAKAAEVAQKAANAAKPAGIAGSPPGDGADDEDPAGQPGQGDGRKATPPGRDEVESDAVDDEPGED